MSETEKITINLGLVDLGQIDLLVQEGFYSNRTDVIRTAIRNQLTTHADEVRQTVRARRWCSGWSTIPAATWKLYERLARLWRSGFSAW
jgi:Arc/MetJ-type ribon-helix-helix transcriptional regulator